MNLIYVCQTKEMNCLRLCALKKSPCGSKMKRTLYVIEIQLLSLYKATSVREEKHMFTNWIVFIFNVVALTLPLYAAGAILLAYMFYSYYQVVTIIKCRSNTFYYPIQFFNYSLVSEYSGQSKNLTGLFVPWPIENSKFFEGFRKQFHHHV